MKQTDYIILGGGCFWCIEAIYQNMDGITSVISGYSGGHDKDPNYKNVCNGTTGHAEVVKINYNPNIITLKNIIDQFWLIHDPTTLNRQGADVGTQYRSIIFYKDKIEKETILKSKENLVKMNIYKDKIVTEIEELNIFYEAEAYHQDYYKNNQNAPYCQFVIKPKLNKLNQQPK